MTRLEKKYRLDYLTEISGGDQKFISQMVTEFIGIFPQSIQKIKDAFVSEKYYDLRMLVHQFAPQLDYMGLSESRHLADQVEALCKSSGDWQVIGNLVERIETLTSDAVMQLREDFI